MNSMWNNINYIPQRSTVADVSISRSATEHSKYSKGNEKKKSASPSMNSLFTLHQDMAWNQRSDETQIPGPSKVLLICQGNYELRVHLDLNTAQMPASRRETT